jgi:hypothetical protein
MKCVRSSVGRLPPEFDLIIKFFTKQGRCVSHTVALPFTLKNVLREQKNYGKLKYFTMPKTIPNLQKNSST